ncbi:hypothetical protein [Nonomuraea typhae]|uniref:Uncharacterized protein n=1 Tax=Nonomuraea typhae TaxID=2603600 RepID=A0ABW7Z8C0_9ACTN
MSEVLAAQETVRSVIQVLLTMVIAVGWLALFDSAQRGLTVLTRWGSAVTG